MKITITLTQNEIDTAIGAIDAMSDNEYDKGAFAGADEAWQSLVFDSASVTLHAAAPGPVTLEVGAFALVCDAVETYCTDADSGDVEHDIAQQAFAVRLARLSDTTVTL